MFKLMKRRFFIKNLTIFLSFWLYLGTVISGSVFADSRAERAASLRDLQELLRETGATWEAGETSMTYISDTETQNMMGLFPAPLDRSGELKEEGVPTVEVDEDVVERGLPKKYTVPYITSVKAQGECGCCYSFAACAMLEGYIKQHLGKSVDLSEQDLLSKAYRRAQSTGSKYGGCNGWFLMNTLNRIYYEGVTLEGNLPYKGYVTAPYSGNGTKYRITGITKARINRNKSDPIYSIKWSLYNRSAVFSSMNVYTDFKHYTGGVYKYTWGKYEGGHAILIVGYDNDKQAFKCKNSWGTGWGENGYFWIAYDQIDSAVKFANANGEPSYAIQKAGKY